MCSYNRVNGTYTSEHPWLLTEVLRKEWEFKGYVMSDWGAVNNRVEGLKAGMDLKMPSSNGINDAEIIAAVKTDTLKEDVLNQSVERILNIIFEYMDNREEQEFMTGMLHQETIIYLSVLLLRIPVFQKACVLQLRKCFLWKSGSILR